MANTGLTQWVPPHYETVKISRNIIDINLEERDEGKKEGRVGRKEVEGRKREKQRSQNEDKHGSQSLSRKLTPWCPREFQTHTIPGMWESG